MSRRGLAIVLLLLPFGAGLARTGFDAEPPHATSFLGSMLVAALLRLGFDAHAIGKVLPLLAWCGSIAVLTVHALRAPTGPWRAASRAPGHSIWLVLPVAAACVALRGALGGGLDAALFALLLLGGLLVLVNHPERQGLAASLYALSFLVHPEGSMYGACAAAYVLWRRGGRPAVRFAASWGVLVLPYLGWRAMGFAAVLPPRRPEPEERLDPRMDVVLVALVQAVLALASPFAPASRFALAMPLLFLAGEEAVRLTGRRAAMAAFAVVAIAAALVLP